MNKTVKRLLLVTHSSEKTGGAQDEFDNIISFLGEYKDEYEMDLIFPVGYRDGFYKKYADSYTTYDRCHLPIAPNSLLSYYGFLKCFFPQRRIIKNFIKNKDYDKCVINVSVLVWPLIFLRKIKMILFVREDIKPYFIKYFLYKLIGYYVSEIIFVSKKNAKEYIEITGLKNFSILMSSFNDRVNYRKSNLPNEILQKLNEAAKSSSLKLACIGNIIELKNQKVLIEALTYMKSIRIGVPHLFLIGDSTSEIEYYEGLITLINENEISDKVFFTDHLINKADYYSVLEKMDILIIVSKMEGLPIIISEAFNLKIPVITTNVGGITEIIKDRVNGLVLNDTEPKTITDAITYLHNNIEVRNRIVNNAYKLYLDDLNFSKNMMCFKSILDKEL